MASFAWYSNLVLELHPNGGQYVDTDVFRATKEDYLRLLAEFAARFQDISTHQQLCCVIAELFAREVIEVCRISKGCKIELTLSRRDDRGHVLNANDALARFSYELIAMTWCQPAAVSGLRAGSMIRRIHARQSPNACLAAIASVFDALCEGRIEPLVTSFLVADESQR